MALTGCKEFIVKEFSYLGERTIRLVQGFNPDESPAYIAVIKRTGENLPAGHEEFGKLEVISMTACTTDLYSAAAKIFAEQVKIYL